MHFFAKYVFFSKVMACLFHLLPRKTKKKHQHTQPTNIDLFLQRGEKQKKDLGALNFVARINAFGSVVKKMRALFQVPKMLLASIFC